jgi:hypothetical protein
MKPKDATAPKRNAELRQRKREAGLAPMEVWVHESDKPKVRAFVVELNTSRQCRNTGE